MAEAFEWSEALMSGVGFIDSQHQDLIKRINQFVAACEDAEVPATIGLLLRFLYIYVDEHFAAEETMMRTSQYPDADKHLAQHAYFREELEGVKNDLATHGPNPALALRARKLLVDWFKNHIANTDKAFAAYLFDQKHPATGTG